MSKNRREFLQHSVGAVAAGALGLSLPMSRASAQANMEALASAAIKAGQKQVVIAGVAGTFGEHVTNIMFKPFTAQTGIEVVNVPAGYTERLARLQAQYMAGAPKEWDVVVLPLDRYAIAKPFLHDLGSCSGLPDVVANAPAESCLGSAVMTNGGAVVMIYDRKAFPNEQPKSWADFWNVQKFPGQRMMPNVGAPWAVITAALLADGVAREKLFPFDLDRAFKKLDEIKSHVIWWTGGDQSVQLMRSGETPLGMMWIGRAYSVTKQGLDANIVYPGAPLDATFWAVTKEAPHPLASLALLNFYFTRPDAHLEFLKATGEATFLKALIDLMPDDIRKIAAPAPQNWQNVIMPDLSYLAANEKVIQSRFSSWIAG